MGKYSAARDLDLSNSVRWYVVANRVATVIYKDRPGHPFKFVERLCNPEGRKTETDLDSDRPGRGFSSAPGSAIRHGLDRRHVHHEQSAKKFAALIGKVIAQADREDRFGKLVIVAEPHFLGLLRAALPEQVKQKVEFEIHHELHQGSDETIQEYIYQKMKQELSA